MTPKQQTFCDEYLIDLNATRAAIRAGYSDKAATVTSSKLLTNAKVQAVIQAATRARSERTQITADDVLRDLVTIKDSAMTTTDGRMADAGAALRALELLGKHLRMFTDKCEVTGAAGGAIQARIELGFVKP